MEELKTPEPGTAPPSPDDRLSSWKEIAAYLGRDVRTVQRWERTQRLPVHRHRHSRLSTAYAFKSELDRWWDQRPQENGADQQVLGSHDREAGADESTPVPEPRWRPLAGLLGFGVTTALIGLLAWQAGGRGEMSPLMPLAANEAVLVTAFENRTGEPVFTGTLEYLIRQELSASSSVHVATPDRVRDALALMRRPLDTPVDIAVGREISVRDGAIRVLVAGRLDRIGDRYALSVELIAAPDGRSIAVDRRVVEEEGAVLDAAIAQAAWIRRTLGERSVHLASPRRYERATTQSLEALQLYSTAMDLGIQFKWQPAVKLLEAAVSRDPKFASAHILLAYALSHTGRPWPEVLARAERAYTLAPTVGEVERYFIEASVQSLSARANPSRFHERLVQAVAAYEAVLQVDPNHYWANFNLVQEYELSSRFDDAVPLAVRVGHERPNDVRSQLNAARALIAWKGDVAAARPFIEQATALALAGLPVPAQQHAWVDLFEAHAAWTLGDLSRAHEIVKEVAARLPHMSGDELEHYAHRVGHMFLALGRCRDARAAYERLGVEQRYEALGMLSMQCDNHRDFVAHMRRDARPNDAPSYQRVMWGPRTGRLAEAETWIADFRARFGNALTLTVADGELAAARRDWATAAAHLERAWARLRPSGQERACLVAQRLADVYLQMGHVDRALEVLEATIPMRTRMFEFIGLSGHMAWIRAQESLARLYRSIGRDADAAARDATIRPLLALSDPDLPLARDLGVHNPRADRPVTITTAGPTP
jgi:tetratricopeptide (TPR) repeat protein